MSDIIRLLPDSVANQIAAGEVIQRPASVIKELVENAIDAGATHVDVLVEEAGRTSLQVIDNGKGMSETDARLAFERHATSKIRQADDLYSLRTMGFRGEALPSIAAVAQVFLRTRMEGQELGTNLHIEGSKVLSQEVCACPQGCNFLIQNLFFNVPARRKFLKSNQTELNNIVQEFERLALVNPAVSFTFSNNGTVMSTFPSGTVLQRIANIFGKKFGTQLLNIDVDTTLCRLTGYVGKPETSRKKGAHQYFFVNGRYMRHPYFHRAVQDAFSDLIPEGEQIPYFLYFEVEPSQIDVNIHPTKTEIKFENEQAIYQLVMAGIKEGLGRYNAVPVLDFDSEVQPSDIPVFYSSSSGEALRVPEVQVNPDFNPFASVPSSDSAHSGRVSGDEASGGEPFRAESKTGDSTDEFARAPFDTTLFAKARTSPSSDNADFSGTVGRFPSANAPFSLSDSDLSSSGAAFSAADTGSLFEPVPLQGSVPDFLLSPDVPFTPPSDAWDLPLESSSEASMAEAKFADERSISDMWSGAEKGSTHFQYHGQYILTSVKSGLLLVDQHRAHTRVLYNRYRQQREGKASPSQGLLFPELLQLSPSDAVLLDEMLDDLRVLGFDLSPLGGGSYSLQGIPAGIEGLNPVDLLKDMVHAVRETARPIHEDLMHQLSLTLARAAAITTGQVLSQSEMSVLLDDLFATDTPNYTPDGKLILTILPHENIAKLFK